MTARGWKRVGAGLTAVLLATTGFLLWRSHRESVAKDALAAEIRADRAARVWYAEPVPTDVESETADQYRQAIAKLQLDDFYGEFCSAMDDVPWSTVPDSVPGLLTANAPALALADAAAAQGACRFEDTSLQTLSERSCLLTLLAARGHAALAAGAPVPAAEEVRRLLRVARDLAATPRSGGAEDVWPWADVPLLNGEQDAARLLSALATAPDLPPEAGPVMAAAARDPWGSSGAIRRSIDAHEDSFDAIALKLLGPDAEALLDKADAQSAELRNLLSQSPLGGNPGLLEKAGRRIREALRPGTPVPKAAELRRERDARAPIVAAERRRDIAALAPGGPLDEAGEAMGVLSPRWFRHVLCDEARIAVARAAAAIRAFRLAEGRPPRALEELVPAVLPEVPLDPFDGKPLLYEVDGEGWRVASRVWPDPLNEGEGNADEYPPAEVRFPRMAR